MSISRATRRAGWAAAIAVVALGGVAHAAPPPEIQKERQSAIKDQSGEQGGTVQSTANNQLVYKPYFASAGVATVPLDANTPVFQGDGKTSVKSLQPGVDVNIHYKVEDGKARVLAVDVLDPAQADAAKKQAASGKAPVPGLLQPGMDAEHQKAVSKAAGEQPGKVVSLQKEELVLQPYQKAAGPARLKISSDTPIFQGNSKLSTQALQPGVDVRVYFDEKREKVVAVDILSEDQAKQAKEQHENAPRGK